MLQADADDDWWTVGDLKLSDFSFTGLDGTGTPSLGIEPSLDMVTLTKTGNTYAFTCMATGNAGTQETAQGPGRLYYTAQALNGKVLDATYTGFVGLNGRPVGSVSLTDDHTCAFVTAFSSAGGSPSVDLALGVTSADLYTTWTIAGTTAVATLKMLSTSDTLPPRSPFSVPLRPWAGAANCAAAFVAPTSRHRPTRHWQPDATGLSLI